MPPVATALRIIRRRRSWPQVLPNERSHVLQICRQEVFKPPPVAGRGGHGWAAPRRWEKCRGGKRWHESCSVS